MEDIFLEKVLPNTRSRLKNMGITVTDNPTRRDDSHNHDNGMYFDFNGLDGIPYNKFRPRFYAMCKDMASYNTRIVYFPLDQWVGKYGEEVYKLQNNPIHNILTLFEKDLVNLKKECKDFIFIFCREPNWFAVTINTFQSNQMPILVSNMESLCYSMLKQAAATGKPPAMKRTKTKEEITKEILDSEKNELVDNIARAAANASTEEELIDSLDSDDRIARMIQDISDDEYGRPKFSNARAARATKVNDAYLQSRANSGKTVKQLIEEPVGEKELPKSKIPVASINKEEWENVQFINFNKIYDIDEDIRLILEAFASKEYPIVVRDIQVEDTSTSEDYLYTYTVAMEDMTGKQFSLRFDVPKLINNRFMRLRGNDKVISGQLFNLPCTKTSDDTVQVVSNYRKIMISRYGALGKSYPTSDRLIKAIMSYKGNDIKVSYGDNSRVCSKYELPVDYIDLATKFNWIETEHYIFIFDQDRIHNEYTVDDTNPGIPFAVMKDSKMVIYTDSYQGQICSEQIAGLMMCDSKGLKEIYESKKAATKHTYSRASIMASHIPMIVLICNSIPFTECLKRAKINYTFSEKRVKYDPDRQGCIKFADGFLLFDIDYSSSMLMNGLYDCDTESYRFIDMNKKSTWLDYLDNFGGRILADGLDNFKEVFMDPITQEVCRDVRVPDDYIDILIYANSLLADNKYIKHTNLASNRYRTTEIIAGHLYQCLATEYLKYRTQAKRGRKKCNMSIKRSALIDAILENPVNSDLSAMSPLIELEANNSATFKGLSGLNSERAYSLEKRTYDPSMVGKLALSTGFAGNVGINRQTSMDMDIVGKRGYIKNTPQDTKSVTKRLSSTEAVTPFGSTRDDPFRTAMTYVQTSKHSMPTNKSMPLLVTNGADEAMAYMVSENYVFRAEDAGEVTEVVPNDHMIIKYKSGTGRYISLKEEVRKNSDGGFYVTIQLTTDKKVGAKFKENEILAWDKATFSNRCGESDNLAYDVGVFAYVAIMATDEGFEDSTSISQWLSEALGSEVCYNAGIELGRNTNIYDIVKVGQPIQEGEPLIIFQNEFDEEDANILLKNITDEDFVSDLGRIRVKSKYTGIVQDVKIYRTCELEELSPSLRKVVKAREDQIKQLKAVYKKNNIPGANTLDPDSPMLPTGKLKNTDGVRIEFFIKYFDNMGVGDKLVAQSANKGVVKYMYPLGDEPTSTFDPTKKIHAVFSSRSFNARMVTSPIVSGAINKGLVNLDEQVKKIMGLPLKPIEEIQG